MPYFNKRLILIIFILLTTLVSACQPSPPTPTLVVKNTIIPTQTPTATLTLIPTSTPTVTPSPTTTLIPSPTPIGPIECRKPVEDYTLVDIHGMYINERTYQMLLYAQELYGGELALTGYHLTQGSYTNQVSDSFGTHNGGGAVDLSVIQYGTYKVLYDDIPILIDALRKAGFAAWLRDFGQVSANSPIHIHAIAIGDRDLSQPAIDQLTGEFGYFRGFNGLPQDYGYAPVADEYGGPILCQWMVDMGYADLR